MHVMVLCQHDDRRLCRTSVRKWPVGIKAKVARVHVARVHVTHQIMTFVKILVTSFPWTEDTTGSYSLSRIY